MHDPHILLIVAAAGLLALAIATGAGLSAWRQWLALRRLQATRGASPSGRPRHDVAELRRRVRRLEAIANGVEL